jgi:acetyl esterase/lipase
MFTWRGPIAEGSFCGILPDLHFDRVAVARPDGRTFPRQPRLSVRGTGAFDPITRPFGLDAPPAFVVYVRSDPPLEPQDVGLHSPRLLSVVRRADDDPALGCVPGGAHSRTVRRLVGRSNLDFRKLVRFLNARLEI